MGALSRAGQGFFSNWVSTPFASSVIRNGLIISITPAQVISKLSPVGGIPACPVLSSCRVLTKTGPAARPRESDQAVPGVFFEGKHEAICTDECNDELPGITPKDIA